MALFISSFLLGIAFCAPPGIITAETIRRGVSCGFYPALLVQLGSICGDLTWATIAIFGASFLFQNVYAHAALALLGMLLLFYIAFKALKDCFSGAGLPTGASASGSAFSTGVFLSLSNPFAVAFWAGASSSIFAGVSGRPEWYHILTFFAAFILGTVLWCFFMAALVAWGRKFVTLTFFRWVNFLCSLTLFYFGIQLGLELFKLIF